MVSRPSFLAASTVFCHWAFDPPAPMATGTQVRTKTAKAKAETNNWLFRPHSRLFMETPPEGIIAEIEGVKSFLEINRRPTQINADHYLAILAGN
jgi:hypothetical protein